MEKECDLMFKILVSPREIEERTRYCRGSYPDYSITDRGPGGCNKSHDTIRDLYYHHLFFM